ncbi:hypothetical protein KFE25_004878 [Diacronema lutheri]|uniref:Uncharacterized protein n=1 Tax=Diacronema lutheri TaxID=2081491 RepID=A0A8J5XKT6_DIALT|nr:hypothetical protein KFE25_004878 [Diacronema lutheri]
MSYAPLTANGGDNREWTRLIASERAAFLDFVPDQPYVDTLTSNLARLRRERNALVGVDAEYRWRVERAEPPPPRTTQPALRSANSVAERPRPECAPPPFAVSTDVPSSAGVRRADVVDRATEPGSARPALGSTRSERAPSTPVQRSAQCTPLARTEPRASIARRVGGASWVPGDEPPGSFYLSRAPVARTFECDEDVDVDALRRRASDGMLVGALARARQAAADALAPRVSPRTAGGGDGEASSPSCVRDAPSRARARARRPRRDEPPVGRAPVMTAGAVRGDDARRAERGAGARTPPARLTGTAALANGLSCGADGRARGGGDGGGDGFVVDAPARAPPSAHVRVTSTQVPNLSARQIKYRHLAVMPAGAPAWTGRLAHVAVAVEASSARKDVAVAERRALEVARRERTLRERELGAPARVGILPGAFSSPSHDERLRKVSMAAVLRESLRTGGAAESRREHWPTDARAPHGSTDGRRAGNAGGGSGGAEGGAGETLAPAGCTLTSMLAAASAEARQQSGRAFGMGSLQEQLARTTLKAERMQMGWLGAHDERAPTERLSN